MRGKRPEGSLEPELGVRAEPHQVQIVVISFAVDEYEMGLIPLG